MKLVLVYDKGESFLKILCSINTKNKYMDEKHANFSMKVNSKTKSSICKRIHDLRIISSFWKKWSINILCYCRLSCLSDLEVQRIIEYIQFSVNKIFDMKWIVECAYHRKWINMDFKEDEKWKWIYWVCKNCKEQVLWI